MMGVSHGVVTCAQGSRAGRAPTAMRRIVISLDDETFEEVRRLAIAQELSFAEAARTLITWGLEDAANA